MKGYKTVDEFIADSGKWKPSLQLLRKILLATELEETVKWGAPTYTVKNKNVVGIGAFKSYSGLWFFQGALLKDEKNKLINAQEGVTKALRQWRFNSIEEINEDTGAIIKYIEEAIKNQKQGKEIKPTRRKRIKLPVELVNRFLNDPRLKTCFESFSPGKRREFAEYITEAKREETKLKRLDKIIPMILAGVGLNDKYR